MSTTRSNHWSLTINNPSEADFEAIERARQKGWKVTGQLEKGENGTPHYQLHLQTPQIRFSAVKKAFPRAHIEVARNVQALETYVNKEETRFGVLPSSQEMYPSLSKFWRLVWRRVCDRNWLHCWDATELKYHKDAFDDLGFPRDFGDTRGKRRQELDEEMAEAMLEAVVGQLIEEGFHVESFYSPPNRFVFKKFHWSILVRAQREEMAQTTRQTDSAVESEESGVDEEHSHVSEEVQEVQVPTLQTEGRTSSSP